MLAPLHWDAEEFDFRVVSEDDEPKTDSEDLRLMFQEETEENSDDCFSWDGADSSSEEEIDLSSVEEDPMAERASRFLGSSKEESKENSGRRRRLERRRRSQQRQQRRREQRQRRRRRRQ